jgi:DNA-binding transcriptional LysR family regulator
MNSTNSIDYDLLRTFVATASARTFTEAAAIRRVSVSAISQQVKTLETQLGVPLFQRSGRRAHLSAAGQTLLSALRAEFARIEDALSALQVSHLTVRGPITLGSPRTFGGFWLRPRLWRLLDAYPDLHITVEFGLPSQLERQLTEGRLDLAILVQSPESSEIEVAQIYTETFLAVASPRYLERRGQPTSSSDFSRHRFVAFDRDFAMHATWWRAHFGRRVAVPEQVVCFVASLDEMMELAKAGVAIAILPDYQVAAVVKRGQLVVLGPKGATERRRPRNPIFCGWRKGAPESARLKATRAALLDAIPARTTS